MRAGRFPAARVWMLGLLAFLLAITNFHRHVSRSGLGYDEGDYYQAVDNGFLANWMDTDEWSIPEFVSQGLRAVRGEISRSELSRLARERRTTAFLRHYHSPLALYPAIVIHHLAPGLSEEMQLRTANMVWMSLWLLGLTAILSFLFA